MAKATVEVTKWDVVIDFPKKPNRDVTKMLKDAGFVSAGAIGWNNWRHYSKTDEVKAKAEEITEYYNAGHPEKKHKLYPYKVKSL